MPMTIACPIINPYTHHNTARMSQQLLATVSKASQSTKASISQFLSHILQPKPEPPQPEDQQQHIEAVFARNTSQLSITKAREMSKDQRSEKLLINHQFNYGEIEFHTIYRIFGRIRGMRDRAENEVFYDLGSGTGKVVFAAALCYPFTACVGIELLESLYNISTSLRQKVESQKQQIEQQLKPWCGGEFALPSIKFINGDFKLCEWSDGSIIFVSSTCYSKDVMTEIEKLCTKLAKGTVVVTLTRRLENVHGLVLKEAFEGATSWGSSTVYIHLKQL